MKKSVVNISLLLLFLCSCGSAQEKPKENTNEIIEKQRIRIDTNTIEHYMAKPVDANFQFIEYDSFIMIIALDATPKQVTFLDKIEDGTYKIRANGQVVGYKRNTDYIYMLGYGFNVRYSIVQVLNQYD